MNPSDRNRVRIQPRKPAGASDSLFQICSSKVFNADNTVVAPINSVTMLTSVATIPSVCCELLIAPSKTFAVEAPNNAFNCAPIWENAAVAPTIQPTVVNTITSNGAIEKAQKKASDAPLVDALSAIQLLAAHFAMATAVLRLSRMTVPMWTMTFPLSNQALPHAVSILPRPSVGFFWRPQTEEPGDSPAKGCKFKSGISRGKNHAG
jgi:hypothetical protein